MGSDNGLVPNRRQAIIWSNDSLLYWHKDASISFDELPVNLGIASMAVGLSLWLLQCQLSSLDGYVDGLVQDCSISIALAMEILQACTKPSIYKIIQCQAATKHNKAQIAHNFGVVKQTRIASLWKFLCYWMFLVTLWLCDGIYGMHYWKVR